MKLTFLFAIAYLALATCFIPHFANLNPEDLRSRKDDIADFWEGVFNHFNLSSPSQINQCYKEANARLYFKLFEGTRRLLLDTISRNSFQLHLELVKMHFLHKNLEQTHACMIMTQDFTDLLDALNVKDRSIYDLGMALHLYYQAHYVDLYEEFQPITEFLDYGDNQAAGEAFGSLLEDIVAIANGEGLSRLAYQGFANGFAIGLGIEEPQDSIKCYDDQAAFHVLEFLYELSATVAEGKPKESELNTLHFVAGKGKEILSKIPKSAFDCDAQSKDHQTVAQSLGIDTASSDFTNLLLKYLNDHRLKYYGYCKGLKKEIYQANMHHAGFVYADLFKHVAASKE